ncbi:Pentapeptide repeat-containing protein [Nitrosomonas marina]|uniref:Pentapeptide repeat-containing protein n=1 Tax=Nitrosomonas marina TaxID=917 RepID=A0A1H9YQU6_9PROT|nr:Pentapeptide repeat-containing protein [Nitrosomonas marina]
MYQYRSQSSQCHLRQRKPLKTDFSNADLTRSDFTSGIFIDAGLMGTSADLSVFSNADLTNANFVGASLIGADFSGADFTGVSLVKLKLAQVSNTTGYKNNNFVEYRHCGNTYSPNYF